MSETPPPAQEIPDDVEPTDLDLKEQGQLDDVLKSEQDYLDEQRIEEAEVAEQNPQDAGTPLDPVDEDTSTYKIEADESQVDLPEPKPEPGDA